MQCPKCKGAGGWSQRTPGPMYVKCPTCSGTGALYTQAEMDAKDREIKTLKSLIAEYKKRKSLCCSCSRKGFDCMGFVEKVIDCPSYISDR
jgi:DnaJ-class molecular chaperone